jgi:hypothetical protein
MNHPETNKEGEARWAELCVEQGWREESQLLIAEEFIRKKGLFVEFATHAQEVADEENS